MKLYVEKKSEWFFNRINYTTGAWIVVAHGGKFVVGLNGTGFMSCTSAVSSEDLFGKHHGIVCDPNNYVTHVLGAYQNGSSGNDDEPWKKRRATVARLVETVYISRKAAKAARKMVVVP